jgi:hypothetical protein
MLCSAGGVCALTRVLLEERTKEEARMGDRQAAQERNVVSGFIACYDPLNDLFNVIGHRGT